MNSGSPSNSYSGGSSGAGVYSQSFPINQHVPNYNQPSGQASATHQVYQSRLHAFTSTSSQLGATLSNPYPTSQILPQSQSKPAPSFFSNTGSPHAHDPAAIPSTSASTAVSATLAPMHALFQDIWTETQAKLESEVSRTHAHYHQLLSSERANALKQLQNASTQLQNAKERVHKAEERTNIANGELQRYMILHDCSLAHTDELVKEIQKIKEENVNAMRRTRREKVEVEKKYLATVKASQGRAEDMDRMKDEWGVTQALNVRLYAENRRLTRELEEARERLLKTENSFDEKIRSEFDIRLARVFADEQRQKSKHDDSKPTFTDAQEEHACISVKMEIEDSDDDAASVVETNEIA